MFLNAASKPWHTSSKSSAQYFKTELSKDYYMGKTGTVPQGVAGEGAKALGLDGSVTEEQFIRLADALHPQSGEKLTQRMKDGRRTGIDITCSAPKSVSIMATVDPRVVEAHDLACEKAREVLMSRASVRDRSGDKWNSQDSVMTGKGVCAWFRHAESRSLDMHLHTHQYIFNLCQDRDGTWKALESREMMQASALVTRIYRKELAAGLERAGYKVTMEADKSGKRVPEIVGVSKELRDLFSSRSKDIAKEYGAGAPADARVRAQENRPDKIKNMTPERSRELQRERMKEAGLLGQYDRLNVLQAESVLRSASPVEHGHRTAAACVEQAKKIAFERASTVPENRLAELAMEVGLASADDARVFGGVDYADIAKAIEEDPTLIRHGGYVTTESLAAEEAWLQKFCEKTKGKCQPINPTFDVQLEGEQGAAVRFALNSRDRVMEIQGGAGTGKSFTLSTVVRGIKDGIEQGAKEQGRDVVMLAPWSGAVESLRSDKHDAATLASFLVSKDEPAPGSIIVLDEAGLVGVEDMTKLMQKASRNDCRVILLGDINQHAPVVRGDALRVMGESGFLDKVRLQEIRRQVNEQYKEVVSHLADGAAVKGAELADKHGFLLSDENQDQLFQSVASRYVSEVKAGRTVGLMCPVWSEINDVQGRVRALLREEGILKGEEREFTSYQSESFLAEAERSDPANCAAFEPSRHIQVTQKIKSLGLEKGTAFEIIGGRTVGGRPMLSILTQDGKHATISAKGLAKAGTSWMPAIERKINVCPGDRLLIRANGAAEKTRAEGEPLPTKPTKGRPVKFINGELVTVKGFDAEGRIQLLDGRTMPATFKNYQHGYALTSHLSQGKTFDTALVVMGRAGLQAANREQFYVSCSRGRQHLGIYTTSKEDLMEAVMRSGARKSALEIKFAARQKAAVVAPGREKSARVTAAAGVVTPPLPGRTASGLVRDAGDKFVKQVAVVAKAMWSAWEKGLAALKRALGKGQGHGGAEKKEKPVMDYVRAGDMPSSKEFQVRHVEALRAAGKLGKATETPSTGRDEFNQVVLDAAKGRGKNHDLDR